MSQENVELVRQAMEALLRRDRDAWLAIHDEDFEIVPIRDWPEGGVRGREAAWDFHMRIRDSFELTPIEVERVDAGADKVLGHLRYDLRGAGSERAELKRYCFAWKQVVRREILVGRCRRRT